MDLISYVCGLLFCFHVRNLIDDLLICSHSLFFLPLFIFKYFCFHEWHFLAKREQISAPYFLSSVFFFICVSSGRRVSAWRASWRSSTCCWRRPLGSVSSSFRGRSTCAWRPWSCSTPVSQSWWSSTRQRVFLFFVKPQSATGSAACDVSERWNRPWSSFLFFSWELQMFGEPAPSVVIHLIDIMRLL